MRQVRSRASGRFGLMVKSPVPVEISHYTSDAGQPICGPPRGLPRSGLTITAVTFNLRYLLLNCRQPGCLFASTPDADS